MSSRWGLVTGALLIGFAATASACGASQAAPNRSPNAIVLDAAISAQQQRTALVHLSLSSSGLPSGETLGGTGTGQIDFDSGSMKATFIYSGSAEEGFQLAELYAGGHFYMAPSQDGQGVSSLIPGKEWIENPGNLAGLASGSASENPADLLGGLQAKGNKVVDLGPSSVAGVSDEEYAVTINPASALAQINKEQMPASVVQGAKAFLSGGPTTLKVWVERSTDSLRQFAITMPFPGSTAPGASITVTMGFTDYGSPVSIEAPPASTVASYAQFEQAAKLAQQAAQPAA